jgi:hypothetical protein
MSGHYIYLMSSLPMLHFGMKPPFSFEKFLQTCHGIISDSDITILKTASQTGEYGYECAQPTLKKWRTFDITLRNELVKMRAARKRLDPLKYIRSGGDTEPAITHIALHARRAPSILEAEKILDRERWRFLDESSVGHYFDIDALIIYAIKLLILERWGKINTLDKSRTLDEVLA